MGEQELKNLIYVSIISADNDEYGLTEDDKQEIMRRYKEDETKWNYILEPIQDESLRHKLIEILSR